MDENGWKWVKVDKMEENYQSGWICMKVDEKHPFLSCHLFVSMLFFFLTICLEYYSESSSSEVEISSGS